MKALSPHPALAREPAELEIQKLAYQLWIEGGCRQGVELDNWLTAKEMLKHRYSHVRGFTVRGSHLPLPRQLPTPPQS